MSTSIQSDDDSGKCESISYVVPLHNECDNLGPLVEELEAVASVLGSFEMVLVDDGSDDGSLAVAEDLAARRPSLRILHLPSRSGQSAALAVGFRAARYPVVVTLDADLQNDPADIPRMLEYLQSSDVVCGVRRQRQDSWVRRASSRIANNARNRVTHESITDVGCSLRVMRRKFLEGIPVFDGMHRFLPTLLRMQGARVTEIDVNHRPRHKGSAKYGIGNRLWRGLGDLYGVRWLQRRHVDIQVAEEIECDS
jgi:glycosyltransferase involved in cell wall biosynthesis